MRDSETQRSERSARPASRGHGPAARHWPRLIVASLALVAAGISLAMPGSAGAADHPALPAGSWVAEAIAGKTVATDVRSTLTFGESGQVNGSGGCNQFAGPVSIDGSSIRFGNLASTMRACPEAQMEQEQQFYAALGATQSWQFDGDALIFLDADGKALVKFGTLDR